MYIKTITYDENKRPITFKDVRFGEIFRISENYFIKINPIKDGSFLANAVNLKDGRPLCIEQDLKIEVYTEKSITLSESKFKSEMEINE